MTMTATASIINSVSIMILTFAFIFHVVKGGHGK